MLVDRVGVGALDPRHAGREQVAGEKRGAEVEGLFRRRAHHLDGEVAFRAQGQRHVCLQRLEPAILVRELEREKDDTSAKRARFIVANVRIRPHGIEERGHGVLDRPDVGEGARPAQKHFAVQGLGQHGGVEYVLAHFAQTAAAQLAQARQGHASVAAVAAHHAIPTRGRLEIARAQGDVAETKRGQAAVLALQCLAEFEGGLGEATGLEMTFAPRRSGVAGAATAEMKRDGMVEEPDLVAAVAEGHAANFVNLEEWPAAIGVELGFDARGSALKCDGGVGVRDERAQLGIAGNEALVDGVGVGGGGQVDLHGKRIHRECDARDRHRQRQAFDRGRGWHASGLAAVRRDAECDKEYCDVDHIADTLCSRRAGRQMWRLSILAQAEKAQCSCRVTPIRASRRMAGFASTARCRVRLLSRARCRSTGVSPAWRGQGIGESTESQEGAEGRVLICYFREYSPRSPTHPTAALASDSLCPHPTLCALSSIDFGTQVF